jgi:ATP-dependent RNA helicase RhlE
VPHTPEDYVHRIGRTGRMDALGDAFTLMSPEEQKDVEAIERFLGRSVPRVILPDFDYKKRGEPKRPGEWRERRDAGREGRGRDRMPGSIVSRREFGHRGNAHAARPGGPDGSAEHRSSGEGAAPPVFHGRRPLRNSQDRRSRKRM